MAQGNSFESRMSESSEVQACARHDFGWSFQLHRCVGCGNATRNRGCIACCSRFCKGCFAQHNCLETSTANTANSTLETAADLSTQLLDDTHEVSAATIVKPACATMEELQQLLDDWETQCVQDRFTDTCNRSSDLLEHATILHCSHGDAFGDIVERAQACHSSLHANGREENQMLDASAQILDIESEIDKLCHESRLLERETKRRQPHASSMRSHVSDVSTTASSGLGSTTSKSAMTYSLDAV